MDNRIVWGVILVILIVAALAYFGVMDNRGTQQVDTRQTEQETH